MTRTPAAHERGAGDVLLHDQRRARRPATDAQLRRARHGRLVAGVALGIARFTGADPRLVRVLWLVSLPLSLGVTLAGYALLWLLLPPED